MIIAGTDPLEVGTRCEGLQHDTVWLAGQPYVILRQATLEEYVADRLLDSLNAEHSEADNPAIGGTLRAAILLRGEHGLSDDP